MELRDLWDQYIICVFRLDLSSPACFLRGDERVVSFSAEFGYPLVKNSRKHGLRQPRQLGSDRCRIPPLLNWIWGKSTNVSAAIQLGRKPPSGSDVITFSGSSSVCQTNVFFILSSKRMNNSFCGTKSVLLLLLLAGVGVRI